MEKLIVAFSKTLWYEKVLIIKTIGIAVIIAILIGILSPAQYTSTAVLLPTDDSGSSGLGGLGALAGMAGLNVGSLMGNEVMGIQSALYPQVVESYPFKNKMMHSEFNYLEYSEPISLYNYMLADTIPSFSEKVLMYTLKLPWTIKGLFTKDGVVDNNDYGVISLRDNEVEVLKELDGFFSVEVDKKSGLVIITADDYEPILVAQKVQKAVDILQEYITAYKTKQAKQSVDFLQEQFVEKERLYKEAQLAFFDYKDKHRYTVMERTSYEYQQLSDRYETNLAVFKSLSSQLEQAKLKLVESTPAFTLLEPVIIPHDKSWPRRSLLIILGVFLGGFIGVSLVYIKHRISIL